MGCKTLLTETEELKWQTTEKPGLKRINPIMGGIPASAAGKKSARRMWILTILSRAAGAVGTTEIICNVCASGATVLKGMIWACIPFGIILEMSGKMQ